MILFSPLQWPFSVVICHSRPPQAGGEHSQHISSAHNSLLSENHACDRKKILSMFMPGTIKRKRRRGRSKEIYWTALTEYEVGIMGCREM